MQQKRGLKLDPFEQQIERVLRPGEFIPDGGCFSFVGELERVVAGIAEATVNEPRRGVALYESFLAGCYAKADELDDSSGSFGQFVHELVCHWIKARQASGADVDETVSMLLARMDNDPYAFCYNIEKDVTTAFDRAGLTAVAKQVRARFESLVSEDRSGYSRTHWSTVLRAIYLAQGEVEAYLAVTTQTKLTSEDCLALANLFVTRVGQQTQLLGSSVESSSTGKTRFHQSRLTILIGCIASCWLSLAGRMKPSQLPGPTFRNILRPTPMTSL